MIKLAKRDFIVMLREPHPHQALIRDSLAKRKIIRAGRRGGKTVIAATICVDNFVNGGRSLYGVPTSEQVGTWWFEVKRALVDPIKGGLYHKNETEHFIELTDTLNRVKGKTVWNADTLRGDYGDLLVLDEYQLMNEDTWFQVGVPMLLDNNGNAIFIYTPPSLRATSASKAMDPRHAAKMFQKAMKDMSGLWQAFHFTSFDNPHISKAALDGIMGEMPSVTTYRREILAEDDEMQAIELVYGKFNEATNLIPRFPLDDEAHKHWPRFVGHDFGGANPAALFFAQDPATGYFYGYQEYLPGPGFSTSQHVAEFKRMTEGATVLKRAGGSPQEDEVRQGYTAHGWPIQAPKIHRVGPQVDRVIGLMELNKLFVFNDLVYYLEEIQNCLWKRDNEGVLTDEIRDEQRFHLCACARYILSDFTPETVRSGGPVTTVSRRYK